MGRIAPEEMSERLVGFVAEREGVAREAVCVSGLRRLAGGASRLLFALDVRIDEGETAGREFELVLRQDPPGRIAPGGMQLEFELLGAAARRGVPVPQVYWCEPESALLGAPFFVMQRVEGEAIARRLLRDATYAHTRSVMLGELGRILAEIHRIDPNAPGLAEKLQRPPEGTTSALFELERLAAGVRLLAVEPHPALDLAERWLRAHAPSDRPLVLVHGDYRVGNFLFDERGTRAVLDWELAHVGDPAEDLAWLCVRAWRFGNDARSAGGLGSRDELLDAYCEAGGERVDRGVLRFWEMIGNFKLALVFITQSRAYLDGAHATVELASLGRRIAEGEDELLRLMREAERS